MDETRQLSETRITQLLRTSLSSIETLFCVIMIGELQAHNRIAIQQHVFSLIAWNLRLIYAYTNSKNLLFYLR
jgi:hypothetical protein